MLVSIMILQQESTYFISNPTEGYSTIEYVPSFYANASIQLNSTQVVTYISKIVKKS